ncbi:hypothetical protein FRC02_011820 [Tulasnella sp. 418]|nr:hypothetical protein FRC02_011820 [Tulasnella sp. 418]
MPIRRTSLDTSFIRFHDSASSLLSSCQAHFKARERDSNIIYPFALKTKSQEPSSPTSRSNAQLRTYITSSSSSGTDSDSEDEYRDIPAKIPEQFWLSLWTTRGRTSSAKLDIVLSCTKGPIGDYPVFLYSNVPDECLTQDFLESRIELLVTRLKSCVSSRRVFSVFGPAPLTRAFVMAWTTATNMRHMPIADPYYAAKHTFCTRETLSSDSYGPLPAGHSMRLADWSDLKRGAELCFGFAVGSEPFVLSEDGAVLEATGMIKNGQMFVYNIASEDGHIETASIVCVTRTSGSVSAITKVYTNPDHRGRKYAERLVRHVSHHLLFEAKKSAVVLFVAHDNKAAEKVYDRVGFAGLCGKPRPEGVSDWIEIGFEDTDLGHW